MSGNWYNARLTRRFGAAKRRKNDRCTADCYIIEFPKLPLAEGSGSDYPLNLTTYAHILAVSGTGKIGSSSLHVDLA